MQQPFQFNSSTQQLQQQTTANHNNTVRTREPLTTQRLWTNTTQAGHTGIYTIISTMRTSTYDDPAPLEGWAAIMHLPIRS